MFVRWAPVSLAVGVSILKSQLSTMTIGDSPYVMPGGQV